MATLGQMQTTSESINLTQRARFTTYTPKAILNKGRRADHWFWTRYSAYPYTGCQHGCAFCYCRERKYCPVDQAGNFEYDIRVKANAPELLRRALAKVPVDLVFTGDYQPAERRFMLSRRMLEVCLDMGFPVFVLSRSPLVVRDLDLLVEINARARSVVAFSIISTPKSTTNAIVRHLEGLSPPSERRFAAMEQVARAGILTGTCCMPILPGITDDEPNFRDIAHATADHGGRFVLAGGLTLADPQRDHFLRLLGESFPQYLDRYAELYPVGSHAPVSWDWPRIGRHIREICVEAGISDRIPRPITPGDGRATTKRVVEMLAERAYAAEVAGEPKSRAWDYRKAAWAIEDLEPDLGRVYAAMGSKGIEAIAGVGRRLGREIVAFLESLLQGA